MKKFNKFLKFYIIAIVVVSIIVGASIFMSKIINNQTETNVISIEEETNKFVNEIANQKLRDGIYNVSNDLATLAYIKPDGGWFVCKNNQVTDFTFYYIDAEKDILETDNRKKSNNFYSNCYISRIDENIVYKHINYKNIISVGDYGAIANDELDDTDKIRLATAKVNEIGGVLIFPFGKYNVSVQGDLIKHGADVSSVIKISTDKDVIVDFCNSTIELKGTQFPNNRIVFANNNTASVEIKNGTLIGDRKTHNYKAILNDNGEISNAQGSYSHCFGFGIAMQNTRNGYIHNMEIYDMTGDGIVVKNGQISTDTGFEYKTIIENCKIHHCRRQGITIGASDVTIVKNTEIYKIGHADEYNNNDCLYDESSDVNAVNGQLPMSGIDIEPSDETFVARQVLIDNVNIYSCSNFGVVGNKGAKVDEGIIDGVIIKNSSIESYALDYATIEDSELIVISEERSKISTLIDNCIIRDTKIIKKYPYYEIFYFSKNEFYNCSFESEAEDETTIGIFMFESDNKVVDCTFLNLRGTSSGSTTYKGYGIALYIENSFNDKSVNNKFINCDILIRDPHHIQKSEFNNCTISLGFPTGEQNASIENPVYCNFTDVVFYNCSTNRYVSSRTATVLTNCNFYGLTDHLFGTIPRTFVNCELEFDNLAYDKYNNTPFFAVNDASLKPAILESCIVRVKGEIKDGKYFSNKHVFGACYLKGNTKIYLEMYNDDVKLKVPNDSWGPAHGMPTDPNEYSYIVYYLGNKSLNNYVISA